MGDKLYKNFWRTPDALGLSERRLDIIERLDSDLTYSSGLLLSLFRSLAPSALLSLLGVLLFGAVGILSFLLVPSLYYFDFVRRKLNGDGGSYVAESYRRELLATMDNPIFCLKAYIGDPIYTKVCFRGLTAADLEFGWHYVEGLIETAMREAKPQRWELFREFLIFVVEAQADQNFEVKLNTLAGRLHKRFAISLTLAPPPIEEVESFTSLVLPKNARIRSVRLKHDIAITDADGEIILLAPVELSHWTTVITSTHVQRHRFRNLYSNDEIVKVIESEFQIQDEFLEHFAVLQPANRGEPVSFDSNEKSIDEENTKNKYETLNTQ